MDTTTQKWVAIFERQYYPWLWLNEEGMNEVKTLLESGADPNIAIGVFYNGTYEHSYREIAPENPDEEIADGDSSERIEMQNEHMASTGQLSTSSVKNGYNLTGLLLDLSNSEKLPDGLIRNWIGDCISQHFRYFEEQYIPYAPHDLSYKYFLKFGSLLLGHRLNVGEVDQSRNIDRIIANMSTGYAKGRFAPVFLNQLQHCTVKESHKESDIIRDALLAATLHISISTDTVRTCQEALAHGANPGTLVLGIPTLLSAVYRGHLDMVKFLLHHGADPNTTLDKTSLGILDAVQLEHEGWNQQKAAFQGFILRKWTGLHIAAYRGLSSIVSLLIVSGSDLSHEDTQGANAIDIALEGNHIPVAFALLTNGLFPNFRTNSAAGLLERIYKYERLDLMKQLLQRELQLPNSYQQIESLQPIRRTENSPALIHTFERLSTMKCSTWQSPPANVCTRCRDLMARSDEAEARLFFKHQDMDASCFLCSLIQDHGESGNSCCYQLATRFEEDRETKTYAFEIKLDGTQGRFAVQSLSIEWHNALQHMKSLDDANTGSPAATTMAQTWLRSCLKNHSQCGFRPFPTHSPTRVLDIGLRQGDDDVKLVQNMTLKEPYVALSHLWGTRNLPQTTVANLNERMHSIPCDTLSQTIRDAIHVVRSLGYRYLWVDALCIIQDSAEDWLAESSKMSSVYSGAVLTLAVADGNDHSQGMIRPRRARCVRPFHISSVESFLLSRYHELDDTDNWYMFPPVSRVQSAVRPKGLLDTRGWILQEQLLSPRILYYGNGELFWDCITVSASESSPISASLLMDDNPDETWALKLIRKALTGGSDQNVLRRRISDVWVQIVKNYSARKLTKVSDKLIALDGILQSLKNILGDTPVGGMWRTMLWYQLTWWIKLPKQSDPNIPHSQFSAPSWSWLVAQEPVYYHNSLRGEKPAVDAKKHAFTELQPMLDIISVESETSHNRNSLSGTLVIKGISFRYRLAENDLKSPISKRWNKSKVALNSGRWLLDRALALPLDVHCVVVAEDSVDKLLICLCLVPDENHHEQWKRIGICHWDGLLWQVAKYTGHQPVETTFTIV